MESGFSDVLGGAVIDVDGIKELRLPPALRRGGGRDAE